MDNTSPVNIIITGGGTGGHLFPGIAIAEEFKLQNSKNNILFAGTGNQFERTVLKNKFNITAISAMGIKGMGIKAKINSILTLPKGVLDSFKIIKRFKPNMIIGMGGYSSGPVILTAWFLGIKTAIHEQNIIPGITNKILSHIVNIIFISFASTKLLNKNSKTIVVGNPVRKGFLQKVSQEKTSEKEQDNDKNRLFTVLITGGSQGAHSINLAIIDALGYLKNNKKINFIHQTGKADVKLTTDAYIKSNIQHTVQPFFNSMDNLYKKADLIICRAGATTIAEITAMGKAAIFIPFPFAADNHQEFNAKALVDKNAALMILEKELITNEITDEITDKLSGSLNGKFTGKKLADKIILFLENRSELKKIEVNSKKFGNANATTNIVNSCFKLMKR